MMRHIVFHDWRLLYWVPIQKLPISVSEFTGWFGKVNEFSKVLPLFYSSKVNAHDQSFTSACVLVWLEAWETATNVLQLGFSCSQGSLISSTINNLKLTI